MTDDVRASINGRKNREYRKMRRLYGVNDKITQMAKIRYLQMKDYTRGLNCRTLHDHDGMVMQKLKEDGSKKRMFNHIKRLMRKQVQKDTSIKILNGSGITVIEGSTRSGKRSGEYLGQFFCINGKVTLGEKNEMMGKGMISEGKYSASSPDSITTLDLRCIPLVKYRQG